MADSEAWKMRQEAKRIVRKTKIKHKTVEDGGKKYSTYIASVNADEFKDWFNKINSLERLTSIYSEELHKRIEKRKASDAYGQCWTMSKNHIQSETMAHLFVHIIANGRVEATQRIDLNVDESRWYVVWLMKDWGYDRALDNEKS